MSNNRKKYRCLVDRVVQDQFAGKPDETKYTAGEDYELSEASYARWERRGVFGPIPKDDKAQRRSEKAAAKAAEKAADKAADKAAGDGGGPGAAMGTTG